MAYICRHAHTHAQTSFYLFKEVSFMNKNRPPKHMYINPRKREKEAKNKKTKPQKGEKGKWTIHIKTMDIYT